jgi:hypothetical protein
LGSAPAPSVQANALPPGPAGDVPDLAAPRQVAAAGGGGAGGNFDTGPTSNPPDVAAKPSDLVGSISIPHSAERDPKDVAANPTDMPPPELPTASPVPAPTGRTPNLVVISGHQAPPKPIVTAEAPATNRLESRILAPSIDPTADLALIAPAAAPQPQSAEDGSDDAARVFSRVRKLMLITNLVTVVAIATVLAVVGYRIFMSGSTSTAVKPSTPSVTAPSAEMTLTLPRGARIVDTSVSEDRLVITLDIGGQREIRTFDVRTLKPLGRLSFGPAP